MGAELCGHRPQGNFFDLRRPQFTHAVKWGWDMPPLRGCWEAGWIHAKDASLDKTACHFSRGLWRVEVGDGPCLPELPLFKDGPWGVLLWVCTFWNPASSADGGPAEGWS